MSTELDYPLFVEEELPKDLRRKVERSRLKEGVAYTCRLTIKKEGPYLPSLVVLPLSQHPVSEGQRQCIVLMGFANHKVMSVTSLSYFKDFIPRPSGTTYKITTQ